MWRSVIDFHQPAAFIHLQGPAVFLAAQPLEIFLGG
jgi:hypothetical protein